MAILLHSRIRIHYRQLPYPNLQNVYFDTIVQRIPLECHILWGHPKILKPLWPQLNSTQIRAQNYQNFDLTPPSGQKLILKIMIFTTFLQFFGPRLVFNGH